MFALAVNGVATVAGHVAEKMAPHVKKHGAKLVPESLKKSKDGQASNLDGAKFVAASSIQGTVGVSETSLPHPPHPVMPVVLDLLCHHFLVHFRVSNTCVCFINAGFSTVWSSLETGAKLVGKSVASETVTTVKFKYVLLL